MSVEEHDKIEEVIDETVETQEPEYTEIEQEAMQYLAKAKIGRAHV